MHFKILSSFTLQLLNVFLTDSLPEDGRIQPDQLKDLNYLECVIKVGYYRVCKSDIRQGSYAPWKNLGFLFES